jgi:hypothetical protein
MNEAAKALFRWLGGHCVILARLGLAFILAFSVATPAAKTLISRLDRAAFNDLAAVVPLSVTKFVTAPKINAIKDSGQDSIQEDQPSATGEVREQTSAAARVSVYGIQIIGLSVVLVVTLWVIVALTRTE